MAVLLAVTAALLYILIIMGDGPKTSVPTEAVVSPQSQAQMPQDTLYFDAKDLYQAQYFFSDPFIRLSDASGWQMQGITVLDYVPEGTSASVRELCLQYVDSITGLAVNVSTIDSPVVIRSLPARGFFATTDQEWTFCGMRAVMMRNGDTLHLHAEQGDVVYQVEGDVSAETLRTLMEYIEL